ncbi:hypothetical protein K0M31_011521, partial [Melipona bicolor]
CWNIPNYTNPVRTTYVAKPAEPNTAANNHGTILHPFSSIQSSSIFPRENEETKRLFTKKTYQRERKIDCSRAGNRQRLSRVERRLDYRRSAGRLVVRRTVGGWTNSDRDTASGPKGGDARIKTRLEGPRRAIVSLIVARRHRLPMCANKTPEANTPERRTAGRDRQGETPSAGQIKQTRLSRPLVIPQRDKPLHLARRSSSDLTVNGNADVILTTTTESFGIRPLIYWMQISRHGSSKPMFAAETIPRDMPVNTGDSLLVADSADSPS